MSVRKSSRISAIQSTNLFEDLIFTLSSEIEGDNALINQITKCGGKIQKTLTKKVTHVIANKNEAQAPKLQAKLKSAFANPDFKVITPNYIQECIKKSKIVSDKKYILKPSGNNSAASTPASSSANTPASTTTTRKRGASAVAATTTTTTAAASTTANGNATKKRKTKKDTVAAATTTTTTTTTAAATTTTTTKTTKKKAAKKDDDDDDDDDSKPQIVKEIRKGSTAVDINVPNSDKYHVHEDAENVYDAILNQTNISFNNNKFYNMQLLKSDSSNNYFVWFRWGRVGEKGQSKLQPCNSLNNAISVFESKFRDKTGNRWEDRKEFVKKNKKYFLLERDYGVDDEEVKKEKTNEEKEEIKIPDSKLELKVQEIIKLIFDISMMEKEMAEIGYDAKKMPLGKLTKEHIKKSFVVLKQLDEELSKTPVNLKNLSDLTSDFYTIIPHDFGRVKPPVINTKILLKKKIEMVESLADIQIATTLLKSQKLYNENPIDTNYKSLNCGLVPLSHDSDDFKMIQTYVKNTHAKTHNYYTLEVEEVFNVDRSGEKERFSGNTQPNKKRKLLWHGSRLTNFAGILSQGLRIAPPEAPVTGYMFGKGVYFADMVSKSANYCCAGKVGLMLLCEVMTGEENELLKSDYNAGEAAKKANKDSTKGCGRTAPDPTKSLITKDGVEVPYGPAIDIDIKDGQLLYNEFIVYDVSQIKMKYLIKMKFNRK